MNKSCRKIILWVILSIFVIIGLWSVLYIHYSSPTRLAMEYIYNHTQPSGRFVYKTNVIPSIKYNDSVYNEIRHAGVLYSMYLCERISKDKFLRNKRILASKYFIKNFVLPINDDMYVVSKNSHIARLGGAGLGLVSLSNLYPDGYADIRMLRGLGKFIVFMQKSDGSFYSEYDINTHKYSDLSSLYYPGEAALGLLYLYEIDSNRLWLDSAKKALLYLANKNIELNGEIFDHWMLVATKKMFDTPDNGLTSEEIVTLREAARKLSNNVIMKQIIYSQDPFLGAFANKKNMNAVATIVEGLSAAYYVVDNKNTKNRISKAVKLSNKYLDIHQIKDGKLLGGVPSQPDWKKSMKKSHNEIRIDNVQHFLGARLTSKGLK